MGSDGTLVGGTAGVVLSLWPIFLSLGVVILGMRVAIEILYHGVTGEWSWQSRARRQRIAAAYAEFEDFYRAEV